VAPPPRWACFPIRIHGLDISKNRPFLIFPTIVKLFCQSRRQDIVRRSSADHNLELLTSFHLNLTPGISLGIFFFSRVRCFLKWIRGRDPENRYTPPPSPPRLRRRIYLFSFWSGSRASFTKRICLVRLFYKGTGELPSKNFSGHPPPPPYTRCVCFFFFFFFFFGVFFFLFPPFLFPRSG